MFSLETEREAALLVLNIYEIGKKNNTHRKNVCV